MRRVCFTRFRHVFAIAVTAASLTACQREEKVVLTDDNVILVNVSDTPITAYDLQLAISDNLGDEAAFSLNDSGREKLLDSLIASKAMALAAAKEASVEELAILDKRVAAYREQLLVKAYLKQHADITPVSSEMVEEYYKKHPEKFGAVRLVDYEIVQFDSTSKGDLRERMLKLFDGATNEKNWKQWVDANRNAPLKLSYIKQRSALNVLPPSYSAILRQLSLGQTSDVFWVDGKAMRFRVNAEEWTAPRPLAEVSAEIRKALAPVQMKESIKKVTDQVLQTTKVERVTPLQ